MAFSLSQQRDEQNHVGKEKMVTMDDSGGLLLEGTKVESVSVYGGIIFMVIWGKAGNLF